MTWRGGEVQAGEFALSAKRGGVTDLRRFDFVLLRVEGLLTAILLDTGPPFLLAFQPGYADEAGGSAFQRALEELGQLLSSC